MPKFIGRQIDQFGGIMELAWGLLLLLLATLAVLVAPALLLYAYREYQERKKDLKALIYELAIQEGAVGVIFILLIMFAPGWTVTIGTLAGLAFFAASVPNIVGTNFQRA